MHAMNEFKVGDAEIRRVEEMPIKSPMWVLVLETVVRTCIRLSAC
jgi:hypothetical protein